MICSNYFEFVGQEHYLKFKNTSILFKAYLAQKSFDLRILSSAKDWCESLYVGRGVTMGYASCTLKLHCFSALSVL